MLFEAEDERSSGEEMSATLDLEFYIGTTGH